MYKIVHGNKIIGQVSEPHSSVMVGNNHYSVQIVDEQEKELLVFLKGEIAQAEPYIEPEKITYRVFGLEHLDLPDSIEALEEIHDNTIVELRGKIYLLRHGNRTREKGVWLTEVSPIKVKASTLKQGE